MGIATSQGGDGLVGGHAYSMSDVLEFQNVREWRTFFVVADQWQEATNDCAIVAYLQSMGKEGMEGRMECQ
jgi:hypothetical protein